MPSGDVATALPPCQTAQKSPNSGDQQTSLQLLLVIVRAVHVIPSGEVDTVLPFLTAQNSPLSGLQQTDCQFPAVMVLGVHVTPSADVAH